MREPRVVHRSLDIRGFGSPRRVRAPSVDCSRPPVHSQDPTTAQGGGGLRIPALTSAASLAYRCLRRPSVSKQAYVLKSTGEERLLATPVASANIAAHGTNWRAASTDPPLCPSARFPNRAIDRPVSGLLSISAPSARRPPLRPPPKGFETIPGSTPPGRFCSSPGSPCWCCSARGHEASGVDSRSLHQMTDSPDEREGEHLCPDAEPHDGAEGQVE